MIPLPQLSAYLAHLVATGKFQIECVDIRDNTAYIYGKLGCQSGVYVDQGFLKILYQGTQIRYLVSHWHPGPCKHAITRIMWQATKISRNPFWVQTPRETLACVHLSSVQKHSSLLNFGASHKPQRSPLSLIVPTLYSSDHSGCTEPTMSGCGFLSPKSTLDWYFIFYLQPQTCISLVCVLSHRWPISNAVSRTHFRFISADCRFIV